MRWRNRNWRDDDRNYSNDRGPDRGGSVFDDVRYRYDSGGRQFGPGYGYRGGRFDRGGVDAARSFDRMSGSADYGVGRSTYDRTDFGRDDYGRGDYGRRDEGIGRYGYSGYDRSGNRGSSMDEDRGYRYGRSRFDNGIHERGAERYERPVGRMHPDDQGWRGHEDFGDRRSESSSSRDRDHDDRYGRERYFDLDDWRRGRRS